MKVLVMVMQICLLCGISVLGNFIAKVVPIGIPGNIIGIFILLILLERKVIRMDRIEKGANFLIAELLLFFIPSAIGVMQFQDVLQSDWMQIVFVIVTSTAAVLFFVALTAEALLRLRVREE